MKCEQCGKNHDRKRFCSNKCKDRWHNTRRSNHVFSATPDEEELREREHQQIMDAAFGPVDDCWGN